MTNSQRNINMTTYNRAEAVEHYIKSQASDPFARARIAAHIKSGIASFTDKGEDAFYTADEIKDAHGRIVYTNIKQP